MEEQNNIPSNIEMTPEYLDILEKLILSNDAKISDYETLDEAIYQYFKFKDFLKDNMKRYNIYSFEHFINERKESDDKRNIHVNSTLMGVLKGAISSLKEFLIKNY